MIEAGLDHAGEGDVRVDSTDLEILERLDAALRDEESLRRKSEIMGRIVRQEYSLDCYVERLTAVLEEIRTTLPKLP